MLYRCTDDQAPQAPALDSAVELGLFGSLAVVLVATLAPFRFAVPSTVRVVIALRSSDVLLNVALFMPMGFLLGMRAFRFGRAVMSPVVQAFVAGAALSGALELTQLFVPMRCPSPIDVLANAAGCALGCAAYLRARGGAERLLARCLARTPSLWGVALFALVLGMLAIAPLELRSVHEGFHWTLGPAPLARKPQAVVIGLLAMLGLAAWLGFALRAHVHSTLRASASALPIVALFEACRGYSALGVASLFTLTLAALCALVSAHAAGRVRPPIEPARLRTRQAPRRIWV